MAKVPAFARAFAGRRRIVGADLWDRSYLDLNGPATVTIGAGNHGEIGFGAMQATLDLGYGPSMVFFTWTGSDELDEVNGDGHAELLDDGTIEIASPIITATKPFLTQNATLLQQPVRLGLSWPDGRVVCHAVSSKTSAQGINQLSLNYQGQQGFRKTLQNGSKRD